MNEKPEEIENSRDILTGRKEKAVVLNRTLNLGTELLKLKLKRQLNQQQNII
jgi:hypothetical protein